ncbi:hypothetical protein HBH56_206310 [Parastagonospora nodorum]|uniref:Heterokaryon incompatibility domain-containing protein n=1 Tax=Phaeosphaeria nodorum (strain SN15 / ATCC MYA-4574 / FGSC 10173) TaxID=321614 RepID=A0A7U2EZD7_PHANO|nr:hypothetical protein HBH56_206310 [Parastagonospora nodorum]QRC94713.1 hypothetical protein JI435_148680 [Parastagonospora nodorum SN15]KAH3923827.1 hypothetical protein HBH54_205180 [Parastagonospora nodorum]KAH3962297.1 hypothetical protein HBH51_176600 [Parastagonospora nodorum]KAH3967150.1 hypothetical protein HBH52_191260 [Parastagonospora nodorum]
MRYVHHDTSVSFQQAIEIKCAICVRLIAALEHGDAANLASAPAVKSFVAGPTTYEKAPIGSDDNSAVIHFRCRDLFARLVLELWSEEPEQSGVVTSSSTGTGSAIEFLLAQNEQCLKEHLECRLHNSEINFFPTRVVEITNLSARICLRECVPAGAQFVALSHCWGKSRPLTLTKSNLAALAQGIAVASLPKTFQDAIDVTKKFGHRYIWIDSLCIVQDDPEDWRVESSQMRNVYQNATFCIAATAASDGNAGLFFDRDAASLMSIKIDFEWTGAEWPSAGTYSCSFAWPDAYTHIDCAPLNQRGWVAQERYLSPRILHFAQKLVFWECRDTITCETHPKGLPGWIQSGNLEDDLFSLKRIVNDLSQTLDDGAASQRDSANEIYWCWCKFLALYTSFRLTKESDILVALQGIAQDVGEKMQDEMVAGLWKKRLVQDMCWSIRCKQSFPRRPAIWRGPSWSWVASAQPVRASRLGLNDTGESHLLSEIADIHVATYASGNLARAIIVLKCRILEYTSLEVQAILDDLDHGEVREWYLIFLRHHSHTRSSEIEGLVVKLVGEGCYQRVGYFRSEEGLAPSALELYHAQGERIIQLW